MTENLASIQAACVFIACAASLVIGIVVLRWLSSLEARLSRIDDVRRDQIINLIEQINDAQKDGYVLDVKVT